MQNFNTNQTRHFYVAGKVATAASPDLYDALDIKLEATEGGELFFIYKNADNLVTRTDTIHKNRIKDLSVTPAAKLAGKLMQHTIAINTSAYANVAALAGKEISLTVTLHGVFDYDADNSISFVVNYEVPASITAANFYLALKDAVLAAMPKNNPSYPFLTATSSANGLVLTQAPQKYVRGKLSGEPVDFSVAFNVHGNNNPTWATDTVAVSVSTVPSRYVLADLEYFALGERGDYYRGYLYPNDYTPTYAINPAVNTADSYDVLNIEYYWAGNVENVQKSPRLIQIAGPTAVIGALYDSIDAAIAGVSSI